FARQGQARRQGACGRRRVPERPDQKCGAVDPPADMAGDPVACLPSVPQRTPAPRAAPPRAKLMQPKREKSQTAKTSDRPTAVFRLNARLLIVGDDRQRIARLLFCGRRGLLDELHFAIDAQNLRHLLLELRIAAFQVVADLVRLHFLLIEYLAHRALNQLGKASVPLRRPMLTRMAGEQSRRPQFVRIAELLGLAAGEVDNPCLGLGGDRRLPAGPRAIVEPAIGPLASARSTQRWTV